MKKSGKRVIQKILGFFGLRLVQERSGRVSEANRRKWLRDLQVHTIIDIGASKGNASLEFKELFPEASLYAFEPLRDCFVHVEEKMRPFKDVHLFNIAVSDQKGTTQMHRSSYSGSSSLLQMADLHKKLFPVTAGETLLSVPTDTLDNVMNDQAFQEPALLKIDVQGLEHKVLAGAAKTLDQVKIIIIETSFCELYVGQSLFGDVYKMLSEKGFVYKGAWDPDFRSPEDGSSVQQDAVFVRP